jgi:serine/threonine protein kinase
MKKHCQFTVQTKLGPSLKDLITADCKFSFREAIQITIRLIERIKIIHENGFVHLDIKPDNILYQNDKKDPTKVTLIDFGHSVQYKSKDQEHIPQKVDANYEYNQIFCSKNSLIFSNLSRRDDII